MPISEPRFKQILRAAAGCFAAASLGIVAWAAWPIQTLSKPSIAARKGSPHLQSTQVQSLDNPSDRNALSNLWSRSLQGRSVAATAKAPVAKPKPRPAFSVKPVVRSSPPLETGIRLVGTVVEQGRGIAIASDRSGNIVFHQAGEHLKLIPSGVLIQSVSTDGVWVQFQGQKTELKVGQTLRQVAQTSGRSADVSAEMPEQRNDSNDLQDFDDGPLDPEERTPLRSEDFPKMSLEDELDSLNGD